MKRIEKKWSIFMAEQRKIEQAKKKAHINNVRLEKVNILKS